MIDRLTAKQRLALNYIGERMPEGVPLDAPISSRTLLPLLERGYVGESHGTNVRYVLTDDGLSARHRATVRVAWDVADWRPRVT